MLWMQAGLDILAEDQEGNEVSMQEGSTMVPAASTSANTRAVHLSPGMVVKKQEQVRCLKILKAPVCSFLQT